MGGGDGQRPAARAEPVRAGSEGGGVAGRRLQAPAPTAGRGSLLAVLGGWLALAVTPVLAGGEYEQDRIRWLGVSRHIAFLLPGGAASGEGGAPLLVALGEPGRSARYALDSWRLISERDRLAVASVSSADAAAWRRAPDGPELLRELVERVAARQPIDRRRVYLFGSGPGGGFAAQVALLQPRYFAAVASFGGYLPRGGIGPIGSLERRLPVLLYRSLNDQQVGSADLAETAGWMRKAGAAVTVEELKAPVGFERRGRRTAERIWSALRRHRLDAAPRFASSRRH